MKAAVIYSQIWMSCPVENGAVSISFWKVLVVVVNDWIYRPSITGQSRPTCRREKTRTICDDLLDRETMISKRVLSYVVVISNVVWFVIPKWHCYLPMTGTLSRCDGLTLSVSFSFLFHQKSWLASRADSMGKWKPQSEIDDGWQREETKRWNEDR